MKNDENDRVLVTNIQRFSLHDGPGIRTTVFLKGCTIRCPWCANPENIRHEIEPYRKDGQRGEYGQWYTAEQLYEQLMKDAPFFRAAKDGRADSYQISSSEGLDSLPGGVTFSGGEPLLQIEKLERLFEKLHAAHIHTAVETSLFTAKTAVDAAIAHIDLFYVDLKLLDPERCRTTLSGSMEVFDRNLEALLRSGRPIVFRVPVIGVNGTDLSGTCDPDNRGLVIRKITESASRGNVIKVELLKEHALGLSKYEALRAAGSNIRLPPYYGVSDSLMNEYRTELAQWLNLDNGARNKRISVEVCKI